MKNNPYLISLLGAGGMAGECINWVLEAGYDIEYLYDSTIKQDKKKIRKGNQYTISNKFRKDAHYIIAVGYSHTKMQIIESIDSDKILFADPVVHPLCIPGDNVNVGKGSILYPYTVLTSDISIGALATINSNVTIGHNVSIGNMFHASPGAVVSGDVEIGDRVFMGCNSCITERLSICNDVIIGAGSVVVSDIEIPGIYLGSPAKFLRGSK